jgi:type II secretory pathway pseudopilin PulG
LRAFPAGAERGFSLIEAIVATVIATIAVLGLAYSFGQGRALISRYEISRAALAAAQEEMETLAATASSDSTLAVGPGGTPGLHGRPFVVGGQTFGVIQWSVSPFDDAADGLAPGDINPFDLKQVVVTVSWTTGLSPGSVSFSRFFPAS